MAWTNQQEAAIKAVRKWLSNKHGPQIFRLFGFAGTGKTTLARELTNTVCGKTLFSAFTGKASLVLRKKGCDASTIHSLIYKPVQDDATGQVNFILNYDSPLATAALLIVDEVSMVGEDQARDLISFGIKILVLGDPAQLPPVKGEGFFINAQPDVMLTEIHRQAADNPIIRLSMDVREGRPLQVGTYGESRVMRRGDIDRDAMRELVMGADQVLCGLNRTRQTFNARVRAIKSIPSNWPVVGDKLVCLKNNREKGLLNGGIWEAAKVAHTSKVSLLRVKSLDEPDQAHLDVEVPNEFWIGAEKTLDWRVLKDFDQFTYGYCLTVHKAQGSQFDNVVLFDESAIFREHAKNWIYTGLTRAAERVTVVI